MHHIVQSGIVVIIAMLTLGYSMMSHATLTLFYHALKGYMVPAFSFFQAS